jgi:SAM-dependent methyltransferase
MGNGNIDWQEQSKRFDEAAEYYDKYRPSYPRELVDLIVKKTGIQPGAKLLEIGPGSGKATELFEQRGFEILGIEPGENLVAAGQRRFGNSGRVKFVLSRFENWEDTHEAFDFAFAAQSFHWVPKPLGFQKCASTLKANQYLGLFWNMYLTNSQPIDDEILGLSTKYGEVPVIPVSTNEECEKLIVSRADEIRASGYFKAPAVYRFPWSMNYTAEEYIGFIRTGNGYLSLSTEDKENLERDVAELISRNGGTITRPYLCVLYLAQRL